MACLEKETGTAALIIVDPEAEDFWRVAERAELNGWACRYFATAAEALRKAGCAEDSIWLINSRLADMPGRELAAMLAARSARPVFLVSETYEPHLEAEALAGGLYFLCKPVPTAALEPLLSSRRKKVRATAAPAAVRYSRAPARVTSTGVLQPVLS